MRDNIKTRCDKKFTKWRGGDISRLESFTDAVFAIAITLLVVSHDVPKNFYEFKSVMWGFVGFGVTFTMLVFIWLTNFKFHRRYGLEDGVTIFLNSLFIFLVLFFIYPLKFLAQVLINFGILNRGFGIDFNIGFSGGFEYYDIFIIYGLGGFAIWFVIILMYLHAYNMREILDLDSNELEITKGTILANSIVCLVILVSITLAIFEVGHWPGLIYLLITPLIFLAFYLQDKILKTQNN
tara:strand:+ start:141 stop:854 length:714 start_codon:yes stop_codon:yes gene_type:complete